MLSLAGIKDIPATELQRYKESLGPKAVRASGGFPLDLFFETVSHLKFQI